MPRLDAMRRLLSLGLSALNSGLRPLGVQLKRTNTPTRDFRGFFEHVKALGFVPQTVIDVGVARGTPPIYDAFPDARYVLVEPVAEFQSTLDALEKRLKARVVRAAAGAKDGEVTFHVHTDLSGSSLLPQAEGRSMDGEARTVPMVRLDSVLTEPLARPALLKLDTQGAELQVLEGLGARISEIDLILIEVSFLPFRQGTPSFAEVVETLRGHGFAAYEILEGHFRALDQALAQVDIAFVREDSALRRDPRFFDDRQADEYLRRWQPRRG
jgi:FkbM family methyltransferase